MYSNRDRGADGHLRVHLEFAPCSSTRSTWQLSGGTFNINPKCVKPPDRETNQLVKSTMLNQHNLGLAQKILYDFFGGGSLNKYASHMNVFSGSPIIPKLLLEEDLRKKENLCPKSKVAFPQVVHSVRFPLHCACK